MGIKTSREGVVNVAAVDEQLNTRAVLAMLFVPLMGRLEHLCTTSM